MSSLAMRFSGKVVLITGASSGIGYAAALRFAREGARLSVTGRNNDALAKLLSECKKNGSNDECLLSVTGDIGDHQFRESLIAATVDRFQRLDVLVNNAGIISMGTCEALPMEDYDNMFNVNVKAPYHLTKLAIPHLRKTKGNIVNVSSVNGIRSFAGVCGYNMTKSALDQLTKTVALEEAAYGIRVNAVNPGVIVTELQRRGGLSDVQYAAFLENSKRTHPLGRAGTVEEVASCIAFLASEEASFCTGNLHSVDGGRGVLGVR